MKPLLTTARALEELSASPGNDGPKFNSKLFLHEAASCDVLLAEGDSRESQKVAVYRKDFGGDHYIPTQLLSRRGKALNRMASFADRNAAIGDLVVPNGWGYYKQGNYTVFLSLPAAEQNSPKWITETPEPGGNDVIFWELAAAGSSPDLRTFSPPRRESYCRECRSLGRFVR